MTRCRSIGVGGVDVVSEDMKEFHLKLSPQRLCGRCGARTELAAHLPESLGQPAYDIFRCAACGFIDWLTQGAPPEHT